MKNHIKLCCFASLSSLFLVGCGETTAIEDVTLSSANYISVAKNVYAQQNGEDRGINLEQASPSKAVNEETLYLTKSVKPRGFRLTDVEVSQRNRQLDIKVDAANKYATITLSGDESAQKTVDMRTFTLPQK